MLTLPILSILYETRHDEDNLATYHFLLGDFGLTSDAAEARMRTGTEPFMAPEIAKRGTQTTKVDIWSLFATIVWLLDTHNFRTECWRANPVHNWLVEIAGMSQFSGIQKMARMQPEKRVSAKELLRDLHKAGSDSLILPEDGPGMELAQDMQDLSIRASTGPYSTNAYPSAMEYSNYEIAAGPYSTATNTSSSRLATATYGSSEPRYDALKDMHHGGTTGYNFEVSSPFWASTGISVH